MSVGLEATQGVGDVVPPPNGHSYNLLWGTAFQLYVLEQLNNLGIQYTTDKLEGIATEQNIEMTIQSFEQQMQNVFNTIEQNSIGSGDGLPKNFWSSGAGANAMKQLEEAFKKIFVMDSTYSTSGHNVSDMEYYKKVLAELGINPDSLPAYNQIADIVNAMNEIGTKGGASGQAFYNALANFNSGSQKDLQTWLDQAAKDFYINSHSTSSSGSNSGSNQLGNAVNEVNLGTQYLGALATIHSTDISMYTQEMSGYVNIGQAVEKDTDTANRTTISNYAR